MNISSLQKNYRSIYNKIKNDFGVVIDLSDKVILQLDTFLIERDFKKLLDILNSNLLKTNKTADKYTYVYEHAPLIDKDKAEDLAIVFEEEEDKIEADDLPPLGMEDNGQLTREDTKHLTQRAGANLVDRRYITSTMHGGFANLPSDDKLEELDRILISGNYKQLSSKIDKMANQNKIPVIDINDYIKRASILYQDQYKEWRDHLKRYSKYKDLEKQLDIILPLNSFMLMRLEQSFASGDFDTFDRLAEDLATKGELIYPDIFKLFEFKHNPMLMRYLKSRGYTD